MTVRFALRALSLLASGLLLACGSSQGAGPSGSSGSSGSSGGSSSSSGGSSGGSGSSGSGGSSSGSMGVQWPSAACQSMTSSLVSKMSRPQKAGQMVMAPTLSYTTTPAQAVSAAVGAAFAPGGGQPSAGTDPTAWANMTDTFAAVQAPNGIPFLYGVDLVHGASGMTGTVVFPHNAGLASSRDAALVTQVTQITASEAAAMGVTWTFAPFMGVAWDDRWGRTYESYSEDPTWAGEMALAAVQGLQGMGGLGSGSPGIMACAKHWAGDGQATAGTSTKGGVVDRGNVEIDLPTLQKYGIAPYLPAIQAGLGCIMVSDARWNGASMTSSMQLITQLLKGMYNFPGFVVTDWDAADGAGGIEATINAGVDMLMEPDGWQAAVTTIANSSNISDQRMSDAVTRILNAKCQAGLFSYKRDPSLLADVGSAAHRAVGRKAVAQSLVVLQNNNSVLPLSKTAKVYVGGSGASSLSNQCGGWTVSWQGNGDATTGTTISQAIGKVTTVVPDMASADVEVVVLSETPYAEFKGDSMTLNTLPAADFTALTQAKATGKPVVAIVMSGRPVLITSNIMNADAWIAAWLPGTEGDGVADILFGTVKPTGKLSHSWPKDDTMDNVMTCCNGNYSPLFPLGFGLTF